ncbi:NmrA family transcriptional regulator [Paludibacter sp. 221]|uniref:NmrA family NAD(P)-binding protein n=1 Tax=Paludibacter sp. 221 TaxID=2302939 RepID=UPI0013D7E5D4|nr:NmrA family NAD(P)-binding protein [Paludibacter sp. 221]NDV47844.1 NmrA family transcriptional regulator [Paludibacter sp. 221]
MNILVTGATGNVGIETIKSLVEINTAAIVYACVRNPEKSGVCFEGYPPVSLRKFDFDDAGTYSTALEGVDFLFLLRPPQIADAEKYFRPLISVAAKEGVKGIVFLSVQGADEMSYVPHAKIEKIIVESGVPYVFLRPSYFMQNFTTTLAADVKEGTVKLPAGNALFNWVDVEDIGRVAATVLTNFDQYKNGAYDITGNENLSFAEAVSVVNNATGAALKYKSVNLIKFWNHKKKQGTSTTQILVMIMLHFFPRFGKQPNISENVSKITGKPPVSLQKFAEKNEGFFNN